MTSKTATPMEPLHGFRSLNDMPMEQGKALVILCPFNQAPPTAGDRIIDRQPIRGLRSFIFSRMLYSANPRTTTQQAGYVAALKELIGFKATTAVLPAASEQAETYPNITGTKHLIFSSMYDVITNLNSHDTVLLSYSDPLGLGWKQLEEILLPHVKDTDIFILNGRGRLLRLTSRNHKMLNRHRFLARTRLLDCLCGPIWITAAAGLSLFDFCRKHIGVHE